LILNPIENKRRVLDKLRLTIVLTDKNFERQKTKMTESKSERIAEQIRKNILETLNLWSSKESQLKFQSNVPSIQLSDELFNLWDDDYKPESEIHKIAFTEKERQVLEKFNLLLNIVAEKTPKNLPNIDEFILTKEWIEVNELAKEVVIEMSK
jgi:hypothetical protein